jgi:hypothetical protein
MPWADHKIWPISASANGLSLYDRTDRLSRKALSTETSPSKRGSGNGIVFEGIVGGIPVGFDIF